MPQLDPYYFLNQVSYTLIVLILINYLTSKYNLPNNIRSNMSRNYSSQA